MEDFPVFAKKKRRLLLIGFLLLIGIIFCIVISLTMGAMPLTSGQVFEAVYSGFTGNATNLRANEIAVVWNIRFPRILCALFVGIGLSIAGVIFQSILRNPLADPYTLGVSTGAAFGASLALYISVTYGIRFPISVFAFTTAIITLLIVIAIAQHGGLLSESLVISGIIVSAILSSGISCVKMLAGENVSAIVFWLMGSLASRTWNDVALIAPIVLLAGIFAFIYADDLNVMTLGDETALALGVHVKRVRLIYLLLGAAVTAACVAVSGIIGFIGLVVPHILRFGFTSDNRALLPLSAMLGALLLLLADTAARTISIGEIPVGVITTLLGGPFFIVIFLRRERGNFHG